jgi:nucleoid DNA-binding protein
MSNNLTKREIVQNIYESADYNHKDVTEIVQKTLDNINKALTNGMNVELVTLAYSKYRFANHESAVTPTDRRPMW